MYRPRHERYSQEKLKAAHKRHTARYNNRKDWRVPEVGMAIRCEHCNKLIIKNRRSHRFCSRKCAALKRYTK
jgi:hypothetical protein